MTTTIRVGDPRELLAYLPYRLGFHPRRSVVVVSVRAARGRVGLVARVDLDDLADPERGATVASGLANHVWRDGAERAVVVVYDDDVAAGSSPEVEAAVGRARQALESVVSRTEAWLVDGERFYAFDCADPWCCPSEGRPLGDLASTEVAAHMVLAGATVAEHRGAVTRVPRASKAARYNVRRVAARWSQRLVADPGPEELAAWRLDSVRAWHAVVRLGQDGGEAPARLLGRVDAGLRDVLVRDAVIMSVVRGPREAERALTHEPGTASRAMAEAFGRIFEPGHAAVPDPAELESWCAGLRLVVAHSDRAGHAPALTLLALLAWWAGDGAVASCWLAEALAADPGYRLAQLLMTTLEAGLPPGWARTSSARDARLR